MDIGPGQPLVFNHVPKTAGTSLTTGLLAALQPGAPFEGYGKAALGGFTDLAQLAPAVRQVLILTPDDLPAAADAVFGHIAPSETRARYAHLHQLTVLREPRARLVSHWLYSRAHTDRMLRGLGDWGDYVKKARLPLDRYLGDEENAFVTDNLITRAMVWPHDLTRHDQFISPQSDEALVEAALQSLSQFDFVGVVEDGNLNARIAQWLGRTFELVHVNESPPMPKGLECDVDAECRRATELIEERSRIDAVLWDHVAANCHLPGLKAEQFKLERDQLFSAAIARYVRAAQAPAPSALARGRKFAAAAAASARRRASSLVRP